jgi:hypothetical protein
MKARSRQMFDKAVSAMIAAIEIYNKPTFEYREETFAVLASRKTPESSQFSTGNGKPVTRSPIPSELLSWWK